MLRRSDQNLAQNRLGLDEVPDQISRIFFGKGVSGSRPSYSSAYQPPADSYGVPQGYAASGYNSYPQAGYSYYYGYEDDIYLLAKLGQAALIIFIILAVVIIIFLLTTCCMAVFKKKESKQQLPPSYVPQPVILQSKADTKTGGEKGLTRSGGMTNLNMDSDSSPTMGGRGTGSSTRTSRRGESSNRSSSRRRRGDTERLSKGSETSMTDQESSLGSHSPVDSSAAATKQPGQRQPWSRAAASSDQPDDSNRSSAAPPPLSSFNHQPADFNSDLSQPRSLSYYEVPSTTTTATFMAYPLPAPVTAPPTVPPPAVRYATAGTNGKSHFSRA